MIGLKLVSQKSFSGSGLKTLFSVEKSDSQKYLTVQSTATTAKLQLLNCALCLFKSQYMCSVRVHVYFKQVLKTIG